MKQTTMFNEWNAKELVRSTDPQSSKRAAEQAVQSGLVSGQCQLFLSLVTDNPGKTSEELGELSGLKNGRFAAARRLPDLRRKNLVTNVGPDGVDTRQSTDSMKWWKK